MSKAAIEKSNTNRLPAALQELSPREQAVVKNLLDGKTQSQALLDAGYSESVALKQQKTVIGRARVQTALVAAMDDGWIDGSVEGMTFRTPLPYSRPSATNGERGRGTDNHHGRANLGHVTPRNAVEVPIVVSGRRPCLRFLPGLQVLQDLPDVLLLLDGGNDRHGGALRADQRVNFVDLLISLAQARRAARASAVSFSIGGDLCTVQFGEPAA